MKRRTGHTLGGAARKAGAIGTAFAVGTAIALVGAVPASAEDVPTSYAQAQFLSGSLLGGDLDAVVGLEGAEAYNDGTKDKVTSEDPLHATVLGAIDFEVPGGIQATGFNDAVNAGAVNQYAEARKGGQSFASAGTVGDDGGVGVGEVESGAAGDLGVDLNDTIGTGYADVLTDFRLSLEAVSAQAVGNLDVASGDYTLDGAVLHLTSPAIADLSKKVLAALGVVDDDIAGLENSLVLDVGGLLGALGLVADPTISVALTADLEAAVRPLLVGSYSTGGVNFNLETGSIDIDLAAIHGGSLNDLPPNTELLSSAVIDPVLKSITSTIQSLIDTIVVRVDQALRQAKLDVDVDLDTTSPVFGQVERCNDILVDVIGPVGSTVDQVLQGLVGGTIGGVGNGLPLGQVLPNVPLVGDLLGGLLGGGTTVTVPTILPTEVVGQTLKTVCGLVTEVVQLLNTSVHVDVHGTVSQILNGAPGTSSATATVAGVPVTVPLQGILGSIIGALNADLLDINDGAVSQILAALNLGLLDPAVEGLLGTAGLDLLLTDVLSILVNVQETHASPSARGMAVGQIGMMFTETAVRISALGIGTVNVAAATVGPNITRVIDPGDPGDPDCTTNCGPGGPGDPGNPGAAGNGGRLAMTGVGIATLVAVILALLAAGAYLAREGYRKYHAQA